MDINQLIFWGRGRGYGSDAVEDCGDEVADSGFVVGVGDCVEAVGDDGANGHGFVAHESAESLKGCAFHFVVCDSSSVVLEGFDS